MDAGAVLKRERKARGISQDALAKRIGKTTSAVAQFESGRIRPMRDVAEAIDAALETGTAIAGAFGFSSPVDQAELRASVDSLILQLAALTQRVSELERVRPKASPSKRRAATSSR